MKRKIIAALIWVVWVPCVAWAGEEPLSPRSGMARRTYHKHRPSILRWWENCALQKTPQEKAADSRTPETRTIP